MNEREKIIHLWFEMWLTKQDLGIDDIFAEITVWGRKDLKDVEDSNLGLKGSPTQIAKASDKVRKGAGEKVALDPAESVDYIMDKLLTKHVI